LPFFPRSPAGNLEQAESPVWYQSHRAIFISKQNLEPLSGLMCNSYFIE
jgi:hypothetical protein